jgi:hypothetical protein
MATTIGMIDGCAFWLAAAFAVTAWVAYHFSPAAALLGAAQRRRIISLAALCVLSLMVSVTCDAVLTGLRLVGREFSIQAIIPMATVAAECVLIALLTLKLYRLVSSMPRAHAVIEPSPQQFTAGNIADLIR